MRQSETIGKLADALAKAQGEFEAVPFNTTNKFLGARYADLGAVIETAKPVIAAHGLAVAQLTEDGGEGAIGVTTILMHGATLKLKDSTAVTVNLLDCSASTSAAPIKIIGGTLDGNRDNSTWTGFTLPGSALVQIGAGSDVTVRDCRLISGWQGVAVTTGVRSVIVDNRFDGLSIGCYYLGAAFTSARVDHQAQIEGNRFTNIGEHAVWFASSKNNRIVNNHITGALTTSHRVDIYPDSTSGILKIRPTSGSGFPDFTDALHTTYVLVGTPWQTTYATEVATAKKSSASLLYAMYISQGGSRSTFTLATSAAADDIFDTVADHGLLENDQVIFTTLTGGGGISVDSNPDTATPYYVIAANLAARTFQVSATQGGASINFTTDITAGFGGIFMLNRPASIGSGDLISIGETDDTVITGNTVTGGAVGGIVVFGASRNVATTGNTVKGAGGAGISIAEYPAGTSPYAPRECVVVGNAVVGSQRVDPNAGLGLKRAIHVLGAVTGMFGDNTVTDDGVDGDAWVALYNTGSTPRTALATSAAADDIIDTSAAHGFSVNDPVKFTALTGGTEAVNLKVLGAPLVKNLFYPVLVQERGFHTLSIITIAVLF